MFIRSTLGLFGFALCFFMFIRLVCGKISEANFKRRDFAFDLLFILLGAVLIFGAIFWPFY